jgi:hypothetical protein
VEHLLLYHQKANNHKTVLNGDDLSVQATGPLMSQEMSPTTFILQSFDCNISLVIISGAPLP